jgi:DNA polymerase-3 subunit epsilon
LSFLLLEDSVTVAPVPHLPALTVFDIETTGLDPRKGHRIVEIAGVRIENGTIMKEVVFSSFVNPERDIPWEAKQVNKISEEMVKHAPTIDTVLPQFLEFAKGTMLVAHNAEFDFGFLEQEKQFCWGFVELPECFCTMRLSQRVHPKEMRHSLDLVCGRYGIALPTERHRALADALLAADVLQKLVATGHITSVDDLRKMAAIRPLVR